MPILQIVILLFFMAVIPLALGAGMTAFLQKEKRNVCLMLVSGYMVMFALFQIIAIPMIEKMCTLTALVWVFSITCIVGAVLGGTIWWVKVGKRPVLREVTENRKDHAATVLWILFGILLLVQLLMAVFFVFADGDDAYYVAAATVAEASDKMYRILPYTGGPTSLDYRHSLAPLPMYIAFLARVTGLHTATVAHIMMQVFLIPLTYCVYGLLGDKLFKGKKRAVAAFLIFTAIAVMWGNTSVYTAETFLLTRTRQGKATLAALAIPMLILLMYMIGERLAEKKKVEYVLWVLVFATVTAACLCSSFGGFLTALLLGVTGLCMVVTYRRWWLTVHFTVCVMPAMVYSVMYIVLG